MHRRLKVTEDASSPQKSQDTSEESFWGRKAHTKASSGLPTGSIASAADRHWCGNDKMSVRIRKTKYCDTANLPTSPPSRRPNSAGHLDVIRIPLKMTHSDSAHVTKPMTNRLSMLAASDACRSSPLFPAKLAWSLGDWRVGTMWSVAGQTNMRMLD